MSSLLRISNSLIRSLFYFFRSAERTLKLAVSFFSGFKDTTCKTRHNLQKKDFVSSWYKNSVGKLRKKRNLKKKKPCDVLAVSFFFEVAPCVHHPTREGPTVKRGNEPLNKGNECR